ncbi:MAG: hypothetical protein H0V17_03955, partial [Deltaproteobacteria bacterium]|nr:hypothetical protein [Deltaproteobacteria bacterium]
TKDLDPGGRRGPTGRIVLGGKKLTFGGGSVAGPITREELAAVAKTKQAELLACFGGGREITRVAVAYRFTVGSDGSVGVVESSSGTLSGAIDACIRRHLRALKFPSKAATTAINLPLIYDTTGTFGLPEKPETPAIEPDPWTPFAVTATPPTKTAAGAARATEAALRSRLGAIDKCFASPAATGSLRILLELDITGSLASVRAGGIGDRDGELCAAKALAGIQVMTPSQEHVEVACDLARGDAHPWRVSPTAAGYEVIEIDARQLKHGKDTLIPGASDPEPLPAETYVVVARTDTLGGMLQLALMWARDATAVLLSVGDGKTPPVFLGMGNATSTEESDGEALRPALRIGNKLATGCVGRAMHKANLKVPAEVSGLLQRLATRCRTLRCAPTLVIAMDSDAVARDLLEVAGAARRAGFDRVLFGGSELGCTAEPKKRVNDPELEPEFE